MSEGDGEMVLSGIAHGCLSDIGKTVAVFLSLFCGDGQTVSKSTSLSGLCLIHQKPLQSDLHKIPYSNCSSSRSIFSLCGTIISKSTSG